MAWLISRHTRCCVLCVGNSGFSFHEGGARVDIVCGGAANPEVKPKPVSATSLPGMIGAFQTEWDASVIETHMLRKELEQVRRRAQPPPRESSVLGANSSDPGFPSRVPILWGAGEDSRAESVLSCKAHTPSLSCLVPDSS
jgi:hypothetical protein